MDKVKQHTDQAMSDAAARSIAWIAIDKWATRFFSIATLVVLGRLLSPADFGVVALAATFMELAAIFADYGFSKALIQRREIAAEHLDTAFWTSAALALVLTALPILAAPALASALHAPRLAQVLRWAAWALPLSAASAAPAALLERGFEFKKLALRRLSSTFAGGLTAIGVAFCGGGVWSLVAQTLVAASVSALVLWLSSSWRPGFRVNRRALGELWPVGFGVFGIELVAFVNSQADRFLIGVFLSAEALGVYYMAMRIVTIMLELFTSVFSAIALPMFSRMQDDREQLRSWLYQLTAASSATSVPCFALAALLAPTLIPLVLGPKWEASVSLFQILSLLGAINAVAYFDRSVLLALGLSRAAFLLTLGQGLLGILLMLPFFRFGSTAVALAVVSRQYLYWPVRLMLLQRTAGIRPFTYLAQWARPLIASLGMVAVIEGAVWGWPALTRWPVLYLVGGVVAGLTVYLGLLHNMQPRALAGLRLTLASRRSAKTLQ